MINSIVQRRCAPLVSAAVLVVAVACGDPYKHTNPYDPIFPVSVTIVGPDTLFSYFENGNYGAVTVPTFADTSLRFASSDSAQLPPVGSQAGIGTFRNGGLVAPPLWPATRTVTISVGVGAYETLSTTAGSAVGKAPLVTAFRHTASKTVVLTQRVTRIQLRCPDTHACDTISAGGTWSVWVDAFDALNQQVAALHNPTTNPSTGTPVATFAVRDTTVASFLPVGIRAAAVTARKTGKTWIVGTRGTLLDSLPLVVR